MKFLLLLPFVICLGCGSAAPDADTVRKLMTADQLAISDPVVNSVGIIMVPIPAGEFHMGTAVNTEPIETQLEKLLQNPDVRQKVDSGETTQDELLKELKQKATREAQHKDGPETPQRLVTISQPFLISSCEITQEQFTAVMDAAPWSGQPLVEAGANYAATYISWEAAAEFCRRLSDQEGVVYRLPTEAEWEYACRAATDTRWSFGDDEGLLKDHAWHDVNAYRNDEQYAHPVGLKRANRWGLFDMHGNVSEWCQDWYAPYDARQKNVSDPKGPEQGRVRVARGGSFAEQAINTRSASRASFGRADYRPEFAAGFRVVRELKSDP